MTSEQDRLEEFLRACVTGGDSPGAVRLNTRAEQRRKARIYRGQSAHHRQAADDLLEGEATLQAIPMGYYAMFHRSNQAIALAGFDSKSHGCTLKGLRGVFDAPDLARDLQRAMDERRNVDYRIDPDDPTFVEFADPEQFVDDVVDPFLGDVEDLIDDEFGEP